MRDAPRISSSYIRLSNAIEALKSLVVLSRPFWNRPSHSFTSGTSFFQNHNKPGTQCLSPALARCWIGRRIHDAATASNFAAPGTQCLSPAPARRNVGADAPMPQPFLILPSKTRSASRRLRPGAILGADAPMLWAVCRAVTAGAVPVHRLQSSAVLSAVSPARLIVHAGLIRPQYKRRRSQLEARAGTSPAL